MEDFDTDKIQAILLATTNLMESDLYTLYKEAFEKLRDESRDLALELVPDGIKGTVEMLENKGGYRAFKIAATFFEDLAAELNKQLEDE